MECKQMIRKHIFFSFSATFRCVRHTSSRPEGCGVGAPFTQEISILFYNRRFCLRFVTCSIWVRKMLALDMRGLALGSGEGLASSGCKLFYTDTHTHTQRLYQTRWQTTNQDLVFWSNAEFWLKAIVEKKGHPHTIIWKSQYQKNQMFI